MEIDDAGQQALACKTIAKALNAQFPQRGSNAKLIDVTASPESICRAVADLVKAMSSGIQMEFLEVHAGLENALRRLTALRGIAGEMRGIAFDKIGEGADGEKVREAQPFRDAF